MYKNEREFKTALVQVLSQGGHCTCIESKQTSIGVPDLFVTTRERDLWIEVKYIKQDYKSPVTIPWRPGQQSWMWDRYVASGCRRWCYTIAGFNNRIIGIPMNNVYKNNRVYASEIEYWADTVTQMGAWLSRLSLWRVYEPREQ